MGSTSMSFLYVLTILFSSKHVLLLKDSYRPQDTFMPVRLIQTFLVAAQDQVQQIQGQVNQIQ